MATIRRLTDIQLGSINTTKVLVITSSETVVNISSGNRAMEVGNLGSYSVYYGQSNLVVNTGNLLLQDGAKMWDTVVDNFTIYFRINSGGVSSMIVVQEYAGN